MRLACRFIFWYFFVVLPSVMLAWQLELGSFLYFYALKPESINRTNYIIICSLKLIKFSHKQSCLGIILKGRYLATYLFNFINDYWCLHFKKISVIFGNCVFLENNLFHLNIHFKFISVKLGSIVSDNVKFSFISVFIIFFINFLKCVSSFSFSSWDLSKVWPFYWSSQKLSFGFMEQICFFPCHHGYFNNYFLVLSSSLCC